MAKDLALVLNNGSLNSAVTTALAAQRFRTIMVYADIAPGASRAKAAYDQQVAHFKPYREHTLSMPFLSMLHAPADAQAIDPRQTGMLATQLLALLPILSAAAAYAAHYQASALYLGLRVGPGGDELERATEYTQIINELLQLPCAQAELEIVTPLLELEAWQVVDLGFGVQAPMDRAWTCSEDAADPCGSCRGCRIREQAFIQAGKPDPMRMIKKSA
jgi:7-cyano-7-deazaguanine synthase in queuosine biosynthesis